MRLRREVAAGWELDEVQASTVAPMICASHYLHSMPAIAVCNLALSVDGWIKGALVFALPPRETAIRYGCVVWELARLWLVDELPGNSESWLIGRAVRHVRMQHPEVGALVSYADPSVGHAGTIYKASNWKYDGLTDSDRVTPRWDYWRGSKRLGRARGGERRPRQSKHRYVLVLGGASV